MKKKYLFLIGLIIYLVPSLVLWTYTMKYTPIAPPKMDIPLYVYPMMVLMLVFGYPIIILYSSQMWFLFYYLAVYYAIAAISLTWFIPLGKENKTKILYD